MSLSNIIILVESVYFVSDFMINDASNCMEKLTLFNLDTILQPDLCEMFALGV